MICCQLRYCTAVLAASLVPALGLASQKGGAQSPSLLNQMEAAVSQKYHKPSELDEKPQIKTRTEPEFPLHVNPGTRGVVVLHVYIDRAGLVEKVEVAQSQPRGVFDDAATTAFRKAAYTPGKRAGKAVKSRLTVQVDFQSEKPPLPPPSKPAEKRPGR
jgi:TonB family protein